MDGGSVVLCQGPGGSQSSGGCSVNTFLGSWQVGAVAVLVG